MKHHHSIKTRGYICGSARTASASRCREMTEVIARYVDLYDRLHAEKGGNATLRDFQECELYKLSQKILGFYGRSMQTGKLIRPEYRSGKRIPDAIVLRAIRRDARRLAPDGILCSTRVMRSAGDRSEQVLIWSLELNSWPIGARDVFLSYCPLGGISKDRGELPQSWLDKLTRVAMMSPWHEPLPASSS